MDYFILWLVPVWLLSGLMGAIAGGLTVYITVKIRPYNLAYQAGWKAAMREIDRELGRIEQRRPICTSEQIKKIRDDGNNDN